MKTSYDAIVVGLGAVGSAAAYHLARRGHRVLGLDRFAPPHPHGSSHSSRIIRKAYFEGDRYLPLLERAYTLWRALEAEADRPLLRITGGLNVGPPESGVVSGARQVAEAHGLEHAVLSSDDVRARFPAFHLPEDHAAVWEADAGVLFPERCLPAHLDQARRHGAALRVEEPATAWLPDGAGVRVTTPQAAYRADRLLLCAGGWIRALLADLSLPLHVERQVVAWFRPNTDPSLFAPGRCPVYIWETAPGRIFYGFPDFGEGVKAGVHHQGERVDHPDALRRAVDVADEEAIRAPLRRLLPGADGPPARAVTCFYTNTPDQHYLIDVHPACPQVAYASACSGHGFKASNAVGEALADLATGRDPRVDIEAFRWRW